jgi:hypothetical protein
MRRKAGFKQYAFLGLFTAALVSSACDDDGDSAPGGEAGKAGSNSGGGGASAGKSNGGSSAGGTKAGTAGTAAAGTESGGTATAGTAPTAGTEPTGGTAPNAGTGGMGGTGAGAGGEGAEPAVNGGESGAPAGGMGGEPGSGGEAGAAPIVYATLVNPGFELGTTHMVPTGWTNEGTDGAAYYEMNGTHGGTGKLSHWTAYSAGAPHYTARTYQTLDPIENGTYSFSMWVNRDWADEQYLFATGYDSANPTAEMKQATVDGADYTKITVSGIVVTSGKITVGVYSDNSTGTWANFDDAELVKE